MYRSTAPSVSYKGENGMSIYNLDRIFKPESIAVVGASAKRNTIGFALIENLLNGGFKGKLIPINPNYPKLQGLKAYPSLSEVKGSVDLAIIATPIPTVPDVIDDCAQAGVGGAVIISAGGKEIGEKGTEIENRIRTKAQKAGIRIIGPNCMGIICPYMNMNASFVSIMPKRGAMAFISQSGAICATILDLSAREQIGFSHFVSIGSMLDVDFGDLIDYLGNDPDVQSIVLYIENLVDIRKFMSAARSVSRVKPILALKSGRYKAGAKAAASHTGAMAGNDDAYDAAFDRAAIVRVDTIEELFDCVELVSKQPLPKGPGLAILTNGGGPGVMAADALCSYGIEPVALSRETTDKLNAVLPPYWSRGNPIDMVGDSTAGRYVQAAGICLKAPEVQGLLVIYVPQAISESSAVANALVGHLKNKSYPVFAAWMGGESVDEGRRILNNAGIPTYETPERAVSAFMYMYSYSKNLEALQEVPTAFSHSITFDHPAAEARIENSIRQNHPYLTEVESKALLQAYGIPVNPTYTAATPAEAVKIGKETGFPVVMKIHSRDILHKSDVDGVRLNIKTAAEIRETFDSLVSSARAKRPEAVIEGVTVQPMIARSDYELIIGSKRDAHFGPLILFGMGGIMTEIFKDSAVMLPPLNRLLAGRLMEKTRIYEMLKGFRNRPPANLPLIEEILIRLSQLVTDFPEIDELDINPLLITGEEVIAVDARVALKPSDTPSPHHLVIGPYPNRYEREVKTGGDLDIFIRPIKPEDAPLLIKLFEALSPSSVYFRFLSPIKVLSTKMLARFTQIDYDREIALVALLKKYGAPETMIGVSRYIGDPDGEKAEISVVVGDPWQGRGVGAELLDGCIAIAKERGVKTLWGIVIAENIHTMRLARKLGFKTHKIGQSNEYDIVLDLNE